MIEKLNLALVTMAQKMRHYFLGHTIIVLTNMKLKNVLQRPDLMGRMLAWMEELSEFDI